MKRSENFSDRIVRLFPPPPSEGKRLAARTITFQVTDACNLQCAYCYQTNKGGHTMDFETAQKFIDLLLVTDETANPYINRSNSPAIVIEFIGGEPFLAIGLMDRITDYFIQQMFLKRHPWATRFRLSISSNGTLYFDPAVQAYIKKHIDHLSLGISVDGNKKLHDACRVWPDGRGSYDDAMRAVRHYTDVFHGRIGSKMTIAPLNVQYTSEAVVSLIASGYTEINLNCVFEKGWDNAHAAVFYTQLKSLADYMLDNDLGDTVFVSVFQEFLGCPIPEETVDNWCGGLGYMIAVDWKGDIFPCIRYMESAVGDAPEPVVIGTVDTGIMATKKQCGWVECMKCVTRRTQSTDECFYCPIAQGCAWCSAFNYQETGSVDKRVTYICQMHKARVLANVYFWNKLYRQKGRKTVFQNHVPDAWALSIISGEELQMLNALASENGAISDL